MEIEIMIYHVKNGPIVELILNERFKVKGTKLEGKVDRKLISYDLADFTAIEGDDANVLGTPSNYNVVDNVPSLKTQEELDAMAVASQKENDRKEAKEIRDEKLSTLSVDVSGVSIQVRPSDELNLRLTIQDLAEGETVEWILSDNSVAVVSKEDLEAAYVLGLTLGQEAYQEYKDVIKAL